MTTTEDNSPQAAGLLARIEAWRTGRPVEMSRENFDLLLELIARLQQERDLAVSQRPEGLYENWAVGYTDLYGDEHHVQYGGESGARDHLPTHPRGAVLQRRWQTDWATVYPRRGAETETSAT